MNNYKIEEDILIIIYYKNNTNFNKFKNGWDNRFFHQSTF